MNRSLNVPCVIILLLSVFPTSSKAIEPGVYSDSGPIGLLLKQTDRHIYCNDVDEIDIGVSDQNGLPLYFTRKQVSRFFLEEKRKDFISVYFGTFRKTPDTADQLRDYLFEMGYKRVLILDAHGGGLSSVVISDTKVQTQKTPAPN